MRYFFDTEFIEDGRTIDLISIGMVCDDGRELYLESNAWDPRRASCWVREHVFPHLGHPDHRISPYEIGRQVINFVLMGQQKPEFWAYYADYDWVALCQLYGKMVDLPVGWPRYCLDLKQKCVEAGDPTLPEKDGTEHHALADAKWVKECWALLEERE